MNKKSKASLTVEAALSLPIFIFCLMFFIYFLQVLTIQDYLQQAITNVGYNLAEQSYVYQRLVANENSYESTQEDIEENFEVELIKDIGEKFMGLGYIKLLMLGKIDKKYIDDSIIKGGYNGLSFIASSILENNENIEIVLRYKIRIPLRIFKIADIGITQRAKLRGWTGFYINNGLLKEVDENSEEVVYITRTGSVYHNSSECSYIKLTVRSVVGLTNDLRNKSGGKYSPCSLCIKEENFNNKFYITDYGNRYHFKSDCSGIKRDVMTINIKDINGRRPCSKCGK
ncbi:MAG TPA: pilus assembly protein [Clostridiales bacterium]|nr:pilus assembly protein [Clostridiales bacterium]